MSFQLAEQLQQKVVPENQLCRLLDISRSGYDTAASPGPADGVRRQRTPKGRVCGHWRGLRQPSSAHGRGRPRVRNCPLALEPSDT